MDRRQSLKVLGAAAATPLIGLPGPCDPTPKSYAWDRTNEPTYGCDELSPNGYQYQGNISIFQHRFTKYILLWRVKASSETTFSSRQSLCQVDSESGLLMCPKVHIVDEIDNESAFGVIAMEFLRTMQGWKAEDPIPYFAPSGSYDNHLMPIMWPILDSHAVRFARGTESTILISQPYTEPT